MYAIQRPWGEAETSALAKYWAEGFSASQIARLLGTGRSRNSVIGRVHRAGLPLRVERTNPRINKKRPRRQRYVPQVPKLNVAKAPPLQSDLKSIAALAPIDSTLTVHGLTNFTCRYPIGDPIDPDFTFCGRTCNNIENPYCTQHQRLAYVPVKKRTHDATARLVNWLDKRGFKAERAA